MLTAKASARALKFSIPAVRRVPLIAAAIAASIILGLSVGNGGEGALASSDGAGDTLTCKTVNGLVACWLVTDRQLESGDGVEFSISMGGTTQTIVTTRQTNPTLRTSSTCGTGDGHCYVFSFTPEQSGGGEVQISGVTAVTSPPPPSESDAPATEPAGVQPQPEPPQQDAPLAVVALQQPEQQPPDGSTDPVALAETQAPVQDQTPQPTAEELAQRERERQARVQADKEQALEAAAAIRASQEDELPASMEPETPPNTDEHSQAEVEAEIAVLKQLQAEREAAEQETGFVPEPDQDSDAVVVNTPEPGSDNWDNFVEELDRQFDSGQPFMVCDDSQVGPDGGALCYWENAD